MSWNGHIENTENMSNKNYIWQVACEGPWGWTQRRWLDNLLFQWYCSNDLSGAGCYNWSWEIEKWWWFYSTNIFLFQKAVLDALVSVMLVEGCGWAEALSRVLELRRTALMEAIAPTPSATAKTQIANFTKLFMGTLDIVFAIFVGKL